MPGIKRILQEESKYTPMKKTTHTVTKSSSRSIIRRTLLGIAKTQYVDNNAQNSTTSGGFVACNTSATPTEGAILLCFGLYLNNGNATTGCSLNWSSRFAYKDI